MAKVHIPQTLRRLTDGQETVEVEGRTLRQVLQALDQRFPGLREQLVQDDGIRSGLAFAINDVLAEDGLVASVPEGATILILPAIGGGSWAAADCVDTALKAALPSSPSIACGTN